MSCLGNIVTVTDRPCYSWSGSGPNPVGFLTTFYCLRFENFPFRRLLRLAGLRWRYSNPPPHGSPPSDSRMHSLISNSSRYCVLILCWRNVSSDPLPSNGCLSTVDSLTSGSYLPNRCVSMDVSTVFSDCTGVHASCCNIKVIAVVHSVPKLISIYNFKTVGL
jgi:hypothetical protein